MEIVISSFTDGMILIYKCSIEGEELVIAREEWMCILPILWSKEPNNFGALCSSKT